MRVRQNRVGQQDWGGGNVIAIISKIKGKIVGRKIGRHMKPLLITMKVEEELSGDVSPQ